MQSSKMAFRGMVVTPNYLATQSAFKILREGGTAMEAMVSAAATIAVVAPHINSIGGDGFWLILPPDGKPIVIEACGFAGSKATRKFYKDYEEIPYKGPKAGLTVAGTVGGWEEALKYSSECGFQRISTSKLLEDAIYYADNGFPITTSFLEKLCEVNEYEGDAEFKEIYFSSNEAQIGQKFCQKTLARTLRELAENGLNGFYRGPLAQRIATDMASLGMPITNSDLANYVPVRTTPLRIQHTHGELLNLPPPTQGLVSLSILAILDKLNINGQHDGEFIHSTVEATKKAFILRDKYITDPRYMKVDPNILLTSKAIAKMADTVSLDQVCNYGNGMGPGDTIWMGIMDNRGFSVSFIQSTYHHFGCGMVLPKTGIIWHNRGVVFNLKNNHIRSLEPGKKPFHTLNPAAAKLNDGRVMIYGTSGADGQPQTQAAIFHRYVVQKMNLQPSISAPRWLYGSRIGKFVNELSLEERFSKTTVEYLKGRGHNIVMLPKFADNVGHAGALVRHPNGMFEGAFDPRSDGSSAGF